jgi:hypothetical protein
MEEEEKRRRRTDVALAMHKWFETMESKAPEDLKAHIQKGKTLAQWLISEDHEAKELKETMSRFAKRRELVCVKCHTKYDLSAMAEKDKAVISIKPKGQKFEKRKPDVFQLTLL